MTTLDVNQICDQITTLRTYCLHIATLVATHHRHSNHVPGATCYAHTLHMPGATWSKNPVPDDYDEPYGESNAIGLLVLVLVAAAIALAFVAGMRMDICACVPRTRVYMYSRAGGGAARHAYTRHT